MRCREIQDRLPEYAAEALSPQEQAVFSAHLEGCAVCRQDLDSLDYSLRALESAASAPAPDLWARFEQALSAQSAECEEIRTLLPARVMAELSRGEDLRVQAHLRACEPCTSEEAAFARSFGALHAAPASAPDLWAAFNRRLGEELGCADVSAVLPEYLAGEPLGSRERALASHLETCPPCAREAAAYEGAQALLARVSAAPVEVDLWPAFARRLDEQAVPFWHRWLAPVSAGWSRMWAQPLARPALAAGMAAVVLALVAPRLQPGPDRPATGPLQARIVSPEPIRPAEKPVLSATREVKAVEAPPAVRKSASRRVRQTARVRVASRPRRSPGLRSPALRRPAQPVAPIVLAKKETPVTQPVQPAKGRWNGLQVAFNPDLTVPAAPPAPAPEPAPSTMSGDMAQAVKRDFVEFAEVIEEIRDVATAPLETKTDTNAE